MHMLPSLSLVLSTAASVKEFVFSSVGGKHPPFDLNQAWGRYTPYIPAESYIGPPSHCRVSQVNLLQRHGARFPTTNAAKRIRAALDKLQSLKIVDKKLQFIQNFVYDLGTESLVPFGVEESHQSGKTQYERYHELVSEQSLPFVRASGQSRVVQSGEDWLEGFKAASRGKYSSEISVIIPEQPNMNNTLSNGNCPNARHSTAEMGTWISIIGPKIATRFNEGAPGANLTSFDIGALMSICPFESVAKEKISQFCDIFTKEDFQDFDYLADLSTYYSTGYGRPLGPVQGVGYLNELFARLTGTLVTDYSNTNRTLDSHHETFPLDRTIFADFTHDDILISVYAALGLFRQPEDLDPTKRNPGSWITRKLVPFTGRLVVERLECGSVVDVDGAPSGRHFGQRKQGEGVAFVRVLVNDALQPLEFCGGVRGVGMCTLESFLESQSYARKDGKRDWEKCSSNS